ncbi:MAG TPA: hypothetical protein VGG05_23050 [Pseudonocardiaceae bacterium]|jgi:hypothetical protein
MSGPPATRLSEVEKQSLRFVLDALTFPAERWEIVAAADFYGADVHTSRRLRGLPPRNRPYRDLQDVLRALESA